MSRWRRVVRRELARYRRQTGHDAFELGELYDGLLPVVGSEFPDNDHPKAKLRQVLQQLRDRDELEFLGEGTYRIRTLEGAAAEPERDESSVEYTVDEYETVVASRSIPRAFRRVVLGRYGSACPVSGVERERLLDVAHVLSWADYPDHRSDLGNVLPLSKTHHAAFDAELFTVDAEFRLRVSPSLETDSDVLRRTLLDRNGTRLDALAGTPLSSDYLRRHNAGLDWV